tara:strand:+ start:145 stop:414 length:270 start_codon:yes stop_codon:yes gene_type:complete
MKSFKEYIGTTGVRVGGIDTHKPIASLGDVPPKKHMNRGGKLMANYTGAVNQRPMVSADPKKSKKENTMGGMTHVRGAQATNSMRTKRK